MRNNYKMRRRRPTTASTTRVVSRWNDSGIHRSTRPGFASSGRTLFSAGLNENQAMLIGRSRSTLHVCCTQDALTTTDSPCMLAANASLVVTTAVVLVVVDVSLLGSASRPRRLADRRAMCAEKFRLAWFLVPPRRCRICSSAVRIQTEQAGETTAGGYVDTDWLTDS